MSGSVKGKTYHPFLFSVYISDLEKHLIEKGISGLENLSKYIEDDLCIFWTCLYFFYADDTVILSETPSDLQHALKDFSVYCETWKLHVHVKKTKLSYFLKGPAPKHIFKFNKEGIEIVKEFIYLGIFIQDRDHSVRQKKKWPGTKSHVRHH